MEGWLCGTNYLDASRATFTHCVGHSSTGRVDHGDEAQEAELVGGEVHVVAVEGVSSGKLGWRQIQVAEACGGRRRGKEGWGDKEHRRLWNGREKCFPSLKNGINLLPVQTTLWRRSSGINEKQWSIVDDFKIGKKRIKLPINTWIKVYSCSIIQVIWFSYLESSSHLKQRQSASCSKWTALLRHYVLRKPIWHWTKCKTCYQTQALWKKIEFVSLPVQNVSGAPWCWRLLCLDCTAHTFEWIPSTEHFQVEFINRLAVRDLGCILISPSVANTNTVPPRQLNRTESYIMHILNLCVLQISHLNTQWVRFSQMYFY